MPPPLSSEQLAIICREIDEEIRDLVAAQAAGHINEAAFVEALLRFETHRAATHALILSASHTFDDWTVISLRIPGQAEPCASFEFHAASGRFRHVGTPCRHADTAFSEQIPET
ncbi:MAG TPA: hypothetical protein VGO11_00810 [Chthoniobacteraceae bacterium]|jgi:hypothetical protein|nr:hypothetical protein [Chthoniobacteraceae bacterium]